jgi:hypothetical protein
MSSSSGFAAADGTSARSIADMPTGVGEPVAPPGSRRASGVLSRSSPSALVSGAFDAE